MACNGSGAPGARVWTWTAAVDAGTGVLTDGGSTETGDYSYFVLARDLNGDGALDLELGHRTLSCPIPGVRPGR